MAEKKPSRETNTGSNPFTDWFYSDAASASASESKKHWKIGDVVEGTVVQVGREMVFVDIGAKTEALLPKAEAIVDATTGATAQVGDRIQARVTGSQDGAYLLSNRLPRQFASKDQLQLVFEQALPVEGKVTGVQKGGLSMDIAGERAFLPGSQVELRGASDLAPYVGRTLTVLITKYDPAGRDLVVSRRAVLEAEQSEQRAQLQPHVVPGAVLPGKVMAVHDYGAFVDLGGMEGLVPVSEMGHVRGQKAQDVVAVGQTVQVQVLRVEDDTKRPGVKRVALSMKALQASPWDAWVQTAQVGQRLRGRVVKLEPFGAFVELSVGVEGLIHVSVLADHPVKHPREVVQVGQEVEVTLLSIDPVKKRLALSLIEQDRQARFAAASLLSLGEVISAVVERVEPHGVLVRIPGQKGGQHAEPKGIIFNGELGIEKRNEAKRHFPVGMELKAQVQRIESDGKVILSIRAMHQAEEQAHLAAYRPDASSAGATLGDLIRKKAEKKK